ncbi:MAG: hypothetical protein NVSMB56_11390 [Pyrinomonadaceae bacterium]
MGLILISVFLLAEDELETAFALFVIVVEVFEVFAALLELREMFAEFAAVFVMTGLGVSLAVLVLPDTLLVLSDTLVLQEMDKITPMREVKVAMTNFFRMINSSCCSRESANQGA